MSYGWLSYKAETRSSGIEGKGTYAKELILKDEIVAIFGGAVLDTASWKKLDDEDISSLALPLDEEFVITPIKSSEAGDSDFVNHSCNPNCGIRGQIMLVAMNDININDEITFDYAMVLANIPLDDCQIDCECGYYNCRKTITGDDWKNLILQKKYLGYFSDYIQKKILIQNSN